MKQGMMPAMTRLCREARVQTRRSSGPPSTPVFHSALMYGQHEVVHGYSWFDREAGRICRMDVPDDISSMEAKLVAQSAFRPLLDGHGTSTYFMTFLGGAAKALFTLANGLAPSKITRTGALLKGLLRASASLPLELAKGVIDMVRFVRQQRSAAFEPTWLAMRVLHATYFEEISTIYAALDLQGGNRIVYIDFVAYDEAAHRRGPDHPVAMEQLRRIDRRIQGLLDARDGHDVVVVSDHGQSASIPYRWAMGHSLPVEVFRACADRPVDERFDKLVDKLDENRIAASRVRKWPGLLGKVTEGMAAAKARKAARELETRYGVNAGEIAVATGGSIAHIYVGRRREGASLEQIAARFPRLIPALQASRGVGFAIVRTSSAGPLVLWRGEVIPLSDTKRLALLEPFKEIGGPVLQQLIRRVIGVRTSGDIVVYGAFAPAGAVTFEPELGSHGGVHPEELDLFVLPSDCVTLPEGTHLDPAELGMALRKSYVDEESRLSSSPVAAIAPVLP
jgi:hypothetical protein